MSEIIKKATGYVKTLMTETMNHDFTFHNFDHVQRTVKAVNKLAAMEGIKEQEIELLNLAVLFHDTGFIKKYDGHEDASAEIARKFLTESGCPESKIGKVLDLILATKLSSEPKNILEKIIRDADIIHLGKKSFFKRNKELRNEWKIKLGKTYTDEEWIRSDIEFFRGHGFFTENANKKFGQQRAVNLSLMHDKLKSLDKKEGDKMVEDEIKGLVETKGKKIKTPDRGIETMFRLTSKNHFTLSSIADSKAGTLISISALIISIILSVLVSKLQEDPYLIIPTIIILLTLLGTIIFSVISTRPKVTALNLDRKAIEEKKGNLLFFGNFINMPVEDYEWGMQELMNDRDYLYNNLIRDIYYLGVVLGRKYRYLRVAYNIFMYGLIASVISYIIAFAL